MTHPGIIEPNLLRPGQRMSLDEFLERWEQMPELKFAELIDGVVYMASPVSIAHADWDALIGNLCGLYCLRTAGTRSSGNATWLMTASGAPQPDCSIRILPAFGGRSSIKKGLAFGVPELVVEVSRSSRSHDLGPKRALYQSAGVNEYVVILVKERRFEWRVLVNGSYELMKDDFGVYRSRILPGLWIDSTAFWSEDSAALLHSLEQGLASQEHADFVARLAQARESAITEGAASQ